MDISTLSIKELKVLAYDILVQIEQAQKNLNIINQQMQKTMEDEPKVEPVEEVKEETVEETPVVEVEATPAE